MKPHRSLLCAACVFVAAFVLDCPKPVAAQFDDLLRRIPGSANSLVLIDVDGLYRSPMAMQKGWKEKVATKWDQVPILLPPEAKRFVLASHLDPVNQLKSDWEIAVIDLAEPLSLNSIARAEGGYVDSIDDVPAVWTPTRAYIVQLEKPLLGMVYPDDRQAVSRWLTLMKSDQLAPLSPYLKEAAKRVRSGGQVVLAIDLSNLVQPHRVDRWLKESTFLADKKVSPKVIAEAIANLRGMTLVILFHSQAMAEARVDFGQNVESLRPVAKELVLAAMERAGAAVLDPQAWKVTVENKSIILRGTLSEAGLTRISGLLELPTTKFSTLAKESQSKEDPGKPTAEASKRYFKSLEKFIADLSDGLRTEAKTAWLEKTARKIDQMPVLRVDDELMTFAAGVSKSLRDMAEQGRNVGRRFSVSQAQMYGNFGYYGDSRLTQTAQEQGASGEVRSRGMQGVNNSLGDMRRKMTKKYNVQF